MQHISILEPARPCPSLVDVGRPVVAGRSQRNAAIWQLWPGHDAPATAREEQRFSARLEELSPPAGTPARWTRRQVTAVLNALRCGITVDDLLVRAPGLRPSELLSAYRHLERRRAGAVRAWELIVHERTVAALAEHGPLAARLLPVVVARLVTAAETSGDRGVAFSVDAAIADIAAVDAVACEIESAMQDADHAERSELGRQLYDLHEPGLWSHPAHLPRRVGSVVPVQVAALMGER